MRTVDRLLAASASIWEDCYRHPFVQGLADGTLGVDRFRFYIIQDYLYLVDYAKVFAVGITKAQSLDVMKLFSGYIHRIFHGEMDIHNGYVETLKITPLITCPKNFMTTAVTMPSSICHLFSLPKTPA